MQNNSSTIGLLLRRLAAFAYDCLLLIALFFIITAIAIIVVNDGEKIEHWSYWLFLLLVSYVFFDWFWRHGGQTLGMRAWRIRLTAFNGEIVTRKHTLHRFIIGCLLFGITLLFMFLNTDRQAAHDKLSKTKIIKYYN